MPHHKHNVAETVELYAKRISSNDIDALSGLYDVTSQRLLRFAVSLTGNQHDGEDAVQSALTKVATNPNRLNQVDQAWPYLLRMTRNEALNIIRKRKRLSFAPNLSDITTLGSSNRLADQESNQAIWNVLISLPARQSEVVVLKIWEEMTFSEIAGVLEISTATVASRYRYAMDKLFQQLSPQQKTGEIDVTP